MKRQTVVVTGMGVVSPLGEGVPALAASLLDARSGIGLWQSPCLEKQFPAGLVGASFDAQFTRLELPYLDRCSQMALIAARQAIADAGLADFAAYGPRAGLFYGSVRGGAQKEEDWYQQLFAQGRQTARPFAVFAIMLNAAAAQISIRHQLLGPVTTYNTACASSATAIGEACRAIRAGDLDLAVAGGAEAPLTAFMFSVWDGVRALACIDPADVGRSCRPFSRDRTGLVLSEGAAFVVLESLQHCRDRGAAAYAEVAGYGVVSDGYHIGSPKAEGEAAAMGAALRDAGMGAEQIDYLNAHATATRGGDEVEAQAIAMAFGAACGALPVSSTKAQHGHLLGATGALEFIITLVAMAESFLPATAFLEEAGADCRLNHVALKPILERPIAAAMSFSSGLGGTNVALIATQHADLPAKRIVRLAAQPGIA